MKRNEGITLVALVITIIVLLILAGVSISLVVGDNGVLTQSQKAATDTNAANAQSAVEMTAASLNSKFMGEVWKDNRTAKIYNTYKFKDFEKELEENGYTIVDHTSDSEKYIDNTDKDTSNYDNDSGTSDIPDIPTVVITVKKNEDKAKTTWKFNLSFNENGTQITVAKQ